MRAGFSDRPSIFSPTFLGDISDSRCYHPSAYIESYLRIVNNECSYRVEF